MSNGNEFERLWKLQASVNKLILDGKRSPGEVADILQEIVDRRPAADVTVPVDRRSTTDVAVPVERRLQFVKSFGICVPTDYNSDTQLDTFRKTHEEELCRYDWWPISDDNSSRPSLKLSPGLKFRVEVFQVTELVTSAECLIFLKSQPKSVLLGAQGATLVYEQRKDELPEDRWHVFFDEKERLWIDSFRELVVPRVYACPDGFVFEYGTFKHPRGNDHCLLRFCCED